MKRIWLISVLFIGLSAHAGIVLHKSDSLLPVRNGYHAEEATFSELTDAEADFSRTRDARKAIRRLYRIVKLRRPVADGKGRYRLFAGLARLSSRLKLYPLAMRFYRKAILEQYRTTAWYDAPVYREILSGDGSAAADTDSCLLGDLPDSSLPDSNAVSMPGTWVSTPIQVSQLLAAFDDGKAATEFAMIVHVKQPIPGRRKAFAHINNVGHTFVTLIKYNTDHSVVARSFGFYPHKKGFLSGTPLHAKAPSDFKDDAAHEWDESVGKFISAERFRHILDLLARYDHMVYDLNHNNCTDFGLQAAALGGIRILETSGRWPLGRGNNPANAGQSVLEGKVENIDPGYKDSLFLSYNVIMTSAKRCISSN